MPSTVTPSKHRFIGKRRRFTKDDEKMLKSPKKKLKRKSDDEEKDREEEEEEEDEEDENGEEEEEVKEEEDEEVDEKEGDDVNDYEDNGDDYYENGDGDENDDNDSNNDNDDDDDDDEVEEPCPKGGRECIQKLRDNIKDEDKTKRLLRKYISWMASIVCDKSRKKARCKLEDRLEVAKSVCQSRAWCKRIRNDIRTYPVFREGMTRYKCREKIKLLEKCQVCNRENPWWIIVTLKGTPYCRERERDSKEGRTKRSRVKYFMGKYCHQRIKLFHDLCHFDFCLYWRCKSMREKGKTRDAIASDESLFNEMFQKLKRCFKKADADYTKGYARVNNQWKRDHDKMLPYL